MSDGAVNVSELKVDSGIPDRLHWLVLFLLSKNSLAWKIWKKRCQHQIKSRGEKKVNKSFMKKWFCFNLLLRLLITGAAVVDELTAARC